MKKKIKLAYIIDEINIGGTENQLLTLVKGINRGEFEPHIICLRSTPAIANMGFNVKIKILGMRKILSLNGIRKLIECASYIKKNKIDIVQVFFFDSTLVGILASKLAGVKHILASRRDLGYWITPMLKRTLNFLDNFTGHYIVNSMAISNYLQKEENIDPAKIVIIYNGLAISQNSEVISNTKKTFFNKNTFLVGLVANLNRPVKRPDVFVDAAISVCRKVENIEFVVIGDGYLRKELEEEVLISGFKDKIHFTGQTENVAGYLKKMDLGALSSDSEGFSNTLIEYMAAGLPIVATDIAANRELLDDGENGMLFKTGDSEALKDKILELYANPGMRQVFSSNNLKKALNYSERMMIDKHEDVYKKLILNQI
ncbi:MAG: glycosyltransferase [Calditrichaceae bacterium]